MKKTELELIRLRAQLDQAQARVREWCSMHGLRGAASVQRRLVRQMIRTTDDGEALLFALAATAMTQALCSILEERAEKGGK